MALSKFKVVVVPLALAAAVGLAATLGVQSARQRRQAQLSERGPQPPAVDAPPPFPYSETTPLAADAPDPDEYTLSVQMQNVLFQTYYNVRVAERLMFRSLPEGAVVVTNPPQDRLSAAAVYHQAHTQGQEGEVSLPPGTALSILTAGPLLQPYDQVIVRGLSRSGRRIDLQVAYAHSQVGRAELPKDEGWRPLLLVPLLLPEGSYELRATWWKYVTPSPATRLEDGKPLDQEPQVYAYRFKVPQGLAESSAVRAAGADFQALAECPCRMTPDIEARYLHLGLRVTNRGEKPLLFDPAGMGLYADNLKTTDGRLLRYGGGSDHLMVARPLSVPPGKSHLFVVRALLEWGRTGESMRLSGLVGSGDFFWYYQGLTHGTYHLTFEYGVVPQALRPPETYWTGRVRSSPVEIELIP
jgi:hypothetical protein